MSCKTPKSSIKYARSLGAASAMRLYARFSTSKPLLIFSSRSILSFRAIRAQTMRLEPVSCAAYDFVNVPFSSMRKSLKEPIWTGPESPFWD